MLHTSVTPEGRFRVGKHCPSYNVLNLRQENHHCLLGRTSQGQEVRNQGNFPAGDVVVEQARPIYEIVNPLPFRGCTFIDSGWADGRVGQLESIRIDPPPPVCLKELLAQFCTEDAVQAIIVRLPPSLRYELAATSTDAEELIWLAHSCCRMTHDEEGNPVGLHYLETNGRLRADIDDFELFETIANNPHLPDRYKELMVLRPGVQGGSEIVGDFHQGTSHVFEYLRTNSYIPWGHYAANFAPASIRYSIGELSQTDMHGLRHLYYQRMYTCLAEKLGLVGGTRRQMMSVGALETLRLRIMNALEADGGSYEQVATLWGWNFGYDFSGSGYRLHASHQMIHQQYALVPQWVRSTGGASLPAFCFGDLVADFI